MDVNRVYQQIDGLVNKWCDRRELVALATLLPAWIHNYGLTDGWAELRDALGRVRDHQQLPKEERDLLKKLWIEVDVAIR